MDNSNKSEIINEIQLHKQYLNIKLSKLLCCTHKCPINTL